MEVRLATLEDVGHFCHLFTEFFAYNAKLQPEYCNAAIEVGHYPQAVIKDEKADILIAIENDVVIGFMHVTESKTPPYDAIVQHSYVEIMAFMVTDSCRRKNAGSMLMNAAKEWGKARNLDYIELIAFSNAKEANAFYQHYGFETKSHIMRYAL
jgi:ribosomal protein S18 acetylase RimI-like enzyme